MKALVMYTHGIRNCKNNKGITLIALIITIIISLILISVTIQMVRTSNLESIAKGARNKTNAAKAEESKIANGNIVEQYVAQNTCSHEWGIWTITKGATETEKGTKERTCTKCGKIEIGETELIIGANINYHEYIGEDGTELSTMPSYTSLRENTGTTGVIKNSQCQIIVGYNG